MGAVMKEFCDIIENIEFLREQILECAKEYEEKKCHTLTHIKRLQKF